MKRAQGQAYFAVKRRSLIAKCAPTLVAFVESYDDAIKLANRKNERTKSEHFYATVHTA